MLCVCDFIVCVVYSCACTLFALMQRLAAARFCSFAAFATFCSRFHLCGVSITFARYLLPASLLDHFCRVMLLPFRAFCRTFALKHLQRSFQTVFRAVLGVYLFRAYIAPFKPFRALI